MKVGLIDVDSHHYPNLALMKLSAWHKAQGDEVQWWFGWDQYDRVYMSKVFDNTYSADILEPANAREIIKGGTGYGLLNALPYDVEHIYPDYSMMPRTENRRNNERRISHEHDERRSGKRVLQGNSGCDISV